MSSSRSAPESRVAVPNSWDRLRGLLAVERAARELNEMARRDLREWYGDEDWPQFDGLDAALKALDALTTGDSGAVPDSPAACPPPEEEK